MYSSEAAVSVPVILLVFITGILLMVNTVTVIEKQTEGYEQQYESSSVSETEILRITEAVSETFLDE